MTTNKKITIEQLECNRCHHKWWPRINNQDKTVIPEVCPSCKSRYWNKERIIVYKNKNRDREKQTTNKNQKK